MRWEVVARFAVQVIPRLSQGASVALVGGGTTDPEVDVLEKAKETITTYFGIEGEPGHSFEWLDLNELSEVVHGPYDLVVCSQVLEHTWHIPNALINLLRLTKPGGLIWINVPASNFSHGLPNYFSAGYSPSMLDHWARDLGLQVVFSEAFGSQRYYTWIHRYRIWPDEDQMRHPMRFRLRGTGSMGRRFGREVKRFGRLLALGTTSSSIETGLTWSTETVALLRRPEIGLNLGPIGTVDGIS